MKKMYAFLKIKKIYPLNFMDVYIKIVFYNIICIVLYILYRLYIWKIVL